MANADKAAASLRFFKTGPGDYGEGDKFLGITVPQTRSLLPTTDALSTAEVLTLLRSEWHEERLLALLILVRRFERARKDSAERASIVQDYLANTRWINNWDLVDSSAPYILGTWLLTRERSVLRELAESQSLWEQRIAVIATLALIRAHEFNDTLHLCARFLTHRHDLMHKACGWMLRELGKRNEPLLRSFLDRHSAQMPRTMLRYAIEKLDLETRHGYMGPRKRGVQSEWISE